MAPQNLNQVFVINDISDTTNALMTLLLLL
jgi:hypothetical protein